MNTSNLKRILFKTISITAVLSALGYLSLLAINGTLIVSVAANPGIVQNMSDPQASPPVIPTLAPCPPAKALPDTDIAEFGKMDSANSFSLYSYEVQGGTGTLFVKTLWTGQEWRVVFAMLELSPDGNLLLGLRRSLPLQMFKDWIRNVPSMDEFRKYMKAIAESQDKARLERFFNCTVGQ